MLMTLKNSSPESQRLAELLEPALAPMGYALVQVRVVGGQNRPTLQIMIEHADGRGVNLDECADVSRACAALIDVENIMDGAYVLEVSSPGVDRPLVRLSDFVKYAGQNAKIEMREKINGQRRFIGKLGAVQDDAVILEQTEGGTVRLPFADINSAKLAVSETLLAPKYKPTPKNHP